MIGAKKREFQFLNKVMVSIHQLKAIKLLVLICALTGTISCSKKSDKMQTLKQPAANIQQFVEEAAINYTMRDTKLLPEEVKVKSSEKKDGYWLVVVSPVPAVPSGYYQYAVMEDGHVELFEEWYARPVGWYPKIKPRNLSKMKPRFLIIPEAAARGQMYRGQLRGVRPCLRFSSPLSGKNKEEAAH